MDPPFINRKGAGSLGERKKMPNFPLSVMSSSKISVGSLFIMFIGDISEGVSSLMCLKVPSRKIFFS